jgi:hypothetical protein
MDVPVEMSPEFDPKKAEEAIARLRDLARNNVIVLPPGETIEDLIAEGRR